MCTDELLLAPDVLHESERKRFTRIHVPVDVDYAQRAHAHALVGENGRAYAQRGVSGLRS